MIKKLKVMTILGTRPEIIRLAKTIQECDKAFNHLLVHTGQNYDYELNEVFFQDLGLRKPDYFLETGKGSALGTKLGQVIEKTYKVIYREKPDAIIILGDTNSSLSVIAAKRLKVPVFHLEAGNRCGDENVPETINRRIVDHSSDINVAYTDYAKENLLKEGLNPLFTFVCGTPLLELYNDKKNDIDQSKILSQLSLTKNKYLVLSLHREENLDQKGVFKDLVKAINLVAVSYQLPIIFSTHPRTKKKIEELGLQFDPHVKILKPFGYFDYLKLQKEALIVLSDSGSVTEEAQIVGFKAVLLRTSTERIEGINWGNILLAGIDERSIMNAITITLSKKLAPHYYQGDNFSKSIVSLVASYTSIVDEVVWRKK